MAKPLATEPEPDAAAKHSAPSARSKTSASSTSRLFSQATPETRPQLLLACREVTSANFEGLDVEREIRSVAEQKLGDTILGVGRFRAPRIGRLPFRPRHRSRNRRLLREIRCGHSRLARRTDFSRLLDAVEAYARSVSAKKITAGVNLARREAFGALYAGIPHRNPGRRHGSGRRISGYNRPGIYILDDWR